MIARLQSQAARPGEIAFFQALVITATLALAAPWLAVVPEAAQWPKLILAAGLATASLWLLGWAYAHGDTGFLATTEYTSFVYAAALGFPGVRRAGIGVHAGGRGDHRRRVPVRGAAA